MYGGLNTSTFERDDRSYHTMLQIGKNGVPLIKYTERFSCSIISLAFKQKRTVFSQYQAPQDEMARIKKDINWNVKEMYHKQNYNSQIILTL